VVLFTGASRITFIDFPSRSGCLRLLLPQPEFFRTGPPQALQNVSTWRHFQTVRTNRAQPGLIRHKVTLAASSPNLYAAIPQMRKNCPRARIPASSVVCCGESLHTCLPHSAAVKSATCGRFENGGRLEVTRSILEGDVPPGVGFDRVEAGRASARSCAALGGRGLLHVATLVGTGRGRAPQRPTSKRHLQGGCGRVHQLLRHQIRPAWRMSAGVVFHRF
jgi:hypothetical protein